MKAWGHLFHKKRALLHTQHKVWLCHQASVYIKEKRRSTPVQAVQEQKQETNRKQEVCVPITSTEDRGGQVCMNITLHADLRCVCRVDKAQKKKKKTANCLTQSCCFINNASRQL